MGIIWGCCKDPLLPSLLTRGSQRTKRYAAMMENQMENREALKTGMEGLQSREACQYYPTPSSPYTVTIIINIYIYILYFFIIFF